MTLRTRQPSSSVATNGCSTVAICRRRHRRRRRLSLDAGAAPPDAYISLFHSRAHAELTPAHFETRIGARTVRECLSRLASHEESIQQARRRVHHVPTDRGVLEVEARSHTGTDLCVQLHSVLIRLETTTTTLAM